MRKKICCKTCPKSVNTLIINRMENKWRQQWQRGREGDGKWVGCACAKSKDSGNKLACTKRRL